MADGTTAADGSPAPHGGSLGRSMSTMSTTGTSGNLRMGYERQSTLVTRERFHFSSSFSVRLTVWMTLPSICWRTPSGLIIWPQSCATTTRLTTTSPVLRLTSTSATAATYVRTFSYFTYVTPRPVAMGVEVSTTFGEGRVIQTAFAAAALSTSTPRGSCR